MGEISIQSYEDVAKFILYQQLFLEPNLIRDRRSVVQIPVEGSDKIIGKMHELVLSNISLWKEEKEIEFIEFLAKVMKFDSKIMIKNYKKKLAPLQKEQLQDKSFKFLLLLSEIIKEVQERSTKQLIELLEINLQNKITKEDLSKRLDELSQMSDVNFSLLINLRILNEYAIIVNLSFLEDIFNEYLEKVIKLILKK